MQRDKRLDHGLVCWLILKHVRHLGIYSIQKKRNFRALPLERASVDWMGLHLWPPGWPVHGSKHGRVPRKGYCSNSNAFYLKILCCKSGFFMVWLYHMKDFCVYIYIEYMGITFIQKKPELQGPASGTGSGGLDGAASLASWMACARVKAWEGSK